MSLLQFITEMLGAVISVQSKVDKRGKEFTSLQFDRYQQHHNMWIKSVALYKANKHGGITLLVNYGGMNKKTMLPFSTSRSIVTKATTKTALDDRYGVIHTMFEKGKFVGFTSQWEINKISNVTPLIQKEDVETQF